MINVENTNILLNLSTSVTMRFVVVAGHVGAQFVARPEIIQNTDSVQVTFQHCNWAYCVQ